LHDITAQVGAVVAAAGVDVGLCHLFCRHTSASLTIQENADPDVLRDLETWMAGAVVDGDARFLHRDEGPDDMSAHVRVALTHTDLTVPVEGSRLMLGTWQALYLWEHRAAPHSRQVVVTVTGDGA
jgi:secondary thiamine-phosphate synthase enzyme